MNPEKPRKESLEKAIKIVNDQADIAKQSTDLGIKEIALEFWHGRTNLKDSIALALDEKEEEIKRLQSQNEKLEGELKTCRELSDLRLDGETRLRKENYKLIELVRDCADSLKYFDDDPIAKETLSLIENSGVLHD